MADFLGNAKFGSNPGHPTDPTLNGTLFFFGAAVDPESGKTRDNLFAEIHPRRHFLSVAPTRSGKGVSLIIPNLLQYRGSAIVIDPKGENAWITAPYRRAIGQKVVILDPWGEVNRRYGQLAGEMETVSHFNPLSILDPASPHYADDVAYLADALIINQGKEPHWDDSARELVSGLIAYMVETPAMRPKASLSTLRQLLAAPPEMLRVTAEEAAKNLGPDSVAARKLGRFTTITRETGIIISTALTQTAILDSTALGANMAESDFSFEDLTNGNATIYLVLPVDKLQTYGRWLRLMVSIAIRTVARNDQPLDLPVAFILDEFGTIGALRAVSQAYGLMAGMQMSLWVFVQDFVQLKRDYPDDWETFIGNSEAVTFYGVMDQFTANYLSDMLGTTTIERISVATAKEREGGILKAGDPNFTRMSDQYYSVPLMRPEQIRGMHNERGIIIRRGDPLFFHRVIYHKQDFFLERARADPRFAGSVEAQAKARETVRAARLAHLVPTTDAAKQQLEAKGYQAKRAMLSGKWDVRGPGGQGWNLANDGEFLNWARGELHGGEG